MHFLSLWFARVAARHEIASGGRLSRTAEDVRALPSPALGRLARGDCLPLGGRQVGDEGETPTSAPQTASIVSMQGSLAIPCGR